MSFVCTTCGPLSHSDEVAVTIMEDLDPDRIGILVYGDGQVTNRWADGTVGIGEERRAEADDQTEGLHANGDCEAEGAYCTWRGQDWIRERLEYLRGEIKAERISYGELAELQSLAGHIDPHDVELLEWAGVTEEEYRQGLARGTGASEETPVTGG